MGSIQLLLGKTRARRRRAVAHNALSGVDRLGRPNFLYITDTIRKRDLVAQEYVQYRKGAAFLPEVTTVSQLVGELARRHGDGRAVWSLPAIEWMTERLLIDEGERWPWLGAVGPTAARPLARLHASWDEARQPSLGSGRAGEVEAFLRHLHERLSGDPSARTQGDALRALLVALQRPSDTVASWLSRPHAVILDDVLHPSALRREVLITLARAWQAFGAHVLFGFESGQDLGGAEAGRFFEYDEEDAVAFSLRPFAATRAFRRALFTELVAEGGEADIVVASADGSLRTVDPGEDPGPPEPADLADRIYTPSRGPAPMEGLGLVQWADPEAEVRGIAHAVKEALLAGAVAEQLWVAFPGLPGYLPLVRRTFTALGIPYTTSAGQALQSLPAVRVVLRISQLAAEGFPAQDTLALAASPLVALLPAALASTLARACRERGVVAGRPGGWWPALAAARNLPPEAEAALAALDAALTPLAPLAAPLPARAWRTALHEVFRCWRILEHAQQQVAEVPHTATLAGLGRLLELVDEVAADATTAWSGAWDATRLAEALNERVEGAAVPDHPTGAFGVQIVGMLELRGIHPPQLWIGGLIAEDFPPPPREDWLLPRAARRVLDEPDAAAECRYLLASALRNVGTGTQALTLSWPATRDGRPVAPSPLLEDLLAVPLDDPPLSGEAAPTLASRVYRPRGSGGAPLGPGELDALLGAAEARGQATDVWRAAAAHPAALDAAMAHLRARRDPEGFGRYDGVLVRPPPLPPVLNVTRLERYLHCPAQYYYANVLRLDPEQPWEPDYTAPARGTLLHTVLSRFLLEAMRLGLRRFTTLDDTAPPRLSVLHALLHRVGTEEITRAEAETTLSPGLARHHRERWLGGLIDESPPGLLASWLLAEREAPWDRGPERVEWDFEHLACGPVRLKGRVDRVDRLSDGTPMVIDYKTGQAPPSRRVEAGLSIQGLVYLAAVTSEATGGSGGPGVSVYQELRGPSRLAWEGWAGDPEVIKRLVPRARQVVPIDARGHQEHQASWAAAVTRMAQGVFHPTLADPEDAGCSWCDYRYICRVDPIRNAQIRDRANPRWQAPLSPAPAPPTNTAPPTNAAPDPGPIPESP